MKMDVKYHEKMLDKMLNNLYVITGLSFGIYNSDHEISYCNECFPDYCSKIREDNTRLELCNVTKYKAASDAVRNGQSITYTCHAGLCETIVPMFDGTIPIGYLVIGQYVDKENIYATNDAFNECCEKYNLDVKEMREKKERLTVADKNLIEAVKWFANIIIDYIITHKIIVPAENEIENAMIDYINGHFTDDLSIDRLCQVFHLSRSAVYKIFGTMKTSPHIYINDIRMKAAKKMLTESDLSVAEIADKCGFCDYNYFIRAFKKHYGIPPKQYKKMWNLNEDSTILRKQ